ncbi:helix-turn-helix domain-containing protein [Membranihabitans maritimus]|uniref:helix-turn-helix domain-containing protein n=1 Tax=Membranihabitans maritimus TaxID=2904244 RepID=UPI001F266A2A|nr:helix-turn-helix transcriptional regulator [Membranihabitans maritimus]
MESVQNIVSVGQQIRALREAHGLPLRKVAAELDIDTSILSKIERGHRQANRQQVCAIARIFGVDEKELIIQYLSDKVIDELTNEEWAEDALKVAEEKLKYYTRK